MVESACHGTATKGSEAKCEPAGPLQSQRTHIHAARGGGGALGGCHGNCSGLCSLRGPARRALPEHPRHPPAGARFHVRWPPESVLHGLPVATATPWWVAGGPPDLAAARPQASWSRESNFGTSAQRKRRTHLFANRTQPARRAAGSGSPAATAPLAQYGRACTRFPAPRLAVALGERARRAASVSVSRRDGDSKTAESISAPGWARREAAHARGLQPAWPFAKPGVPRVASEGASAEQRSAAQRGCCWNRSSPRGAHNHNHSRTHVRSLTRGSLQRGPASGRCLLPQSSRSGCRRARCG